MDNQRGRQSSAALALVPRIGPQREEDERGTPSDSRRSAVLPGARLEPPAHLNAAQREIWNRTVQSRPRDWFGLEHVPLLEQYVRHCCIAAALSHKLEALGRSSLRSSAELKRYRTMRAMHQQESRMIGVLATKMRLTQQSMYNAKRANTAAAAAKGIRKPWQRD